MQISEQQKRVLVELMNNRMVHPASPFVSLPVAEKAST